MAHDSLDRAALLNPTDGVTPAMAEAGIDALLFYADEFLGGFSRSWQEQVVSAVYASMAEHSPS